MHSTGLMCGWVGPQRLVSGKGPGSRVKTFTVFISAFFVVNLGVPIIHYPTGVYLGYITLLFSTSQGKNVKIMF